MERGRIISYRGVRDNLTGHALRLGMRPRLVHSRVFSYGTETRKALDKVFSPERLRPARYRVCTYDGIKDTLSGHARRLGLCVTTVVWRSHRYGLATKAAKDKVFSQKLLVQKGAGITLNGETRSCSEWAKHLGLKTRTMRRRIQRGELKPDKAAFFLRPKGEHIVGVKMYTYRGETHNLWVWSRKLGITESALAKRLAAGATVRQAFQRGNWACPPPAVRVEAQGNHTRRKLAALGIFA